MARKAALRVGLISLDMNYKYISQLLFLSLFLCLNEQS